LVHREVVLVRRSVRRRAGRLERALVEVRGDADAGRVGHGVAHAALALLEGERPAQRQRRLAGLGPGRDRPLLADRDRDFRACEEVLAEAVGHRRPAEADRDVGGVSRHRGVQLGQCRQPHLAELVEVESADRGDELPGRHRARPVPVDPRHVGEGVRVLQRRVVAGPVAHQHQVVVVVDDARDRGAAAQVDQLGMAGQASPCRGEPVAGVADPSIVDGQDLDDAAGHRVDLAVEQHQVAGRQRGARPGRCGTGHRAHRRHRRHRAHRAGPEHGSA
jgi:hypothetical protein